MLLKSGRETSVPSRERRVTHLIVIVRWIAVGVNTTDAQFLLRRLTWTVHVRRMLLLLHQFHLGGKGVTLGWKIHRETLAPTYLLSICRLRDVVVLLWLLLDVHVLLLLLLTMGDMRGLLLIV